MSPLGHLRFHLLHRLDLGFDLHAIADHHAAGFEHLVPREPEILAIDRKDFGLTWNQALETGGVLVGDTVEIEAEIEAVKQVAAKVA